MIRITFLLFLFFGFQDQSAVSSDSLTIHIHQAASDQGLIRVLIFSKQEGFPSEVDKALKSYSVKPKNKSVQLEVKNLPYGKYAVAVIHDEDENGKLNTNPVGYPTEKFGFSNNPKTYFGPPSFDKAAFDHKSTSQTIKISLR